jgi:hypothetical protein
MGASTEVGGKRVSAKGFECSIINGLLAFSIHLCGSSVYQITPVGFEGGSGDQMDSQAVVFALFWASIGRVINAGLFQLNLTHKILDVHSYLMKV